jgi:hypothetical protein
MKTQSQTALIVEDKAVVLHTQVDFCEKLLEVTLTKEDDLNSRKDILLAQALSLRRSWMRRILLSFYGRMNKGIHQTYL